MNIAIDIRVSGDNGEEIETVSRKFSGEFNDSLDWGKGIDQYGKSFDSFLNEFLTSSGRIFRQALLHGCQRKQQKEKKKLKENGSNEIAYMIKFGNGKKLEGSIPINMTFDQKNKSEHKNKSRYSREETGYKTYNKKEKQEEFISYFMEKAVKRYESNFIHLGKLMERTNLKERDEKNNANYNSKINM